jgi:hypothetical protein
MASREMRSVVIAAVAGILGTVVGAVSTAYMSAHVQQEERRLRGVLESFKFEQTALSVEVLQLKQFLDAQRDLSLVSGPSIGRMAQVVRSYPNCWDSFAETCEDFYVESIRVMREELRSGHATADDIKMLLHGKFVTASRAVQRLQSNSR